MRHVLPSNKRLRRQPTIFVFFFLREEADDAIDKDVMRR
jgi:hypothetical protein